MVNQQELHRYIIVDVETAGPNPGRYALLSIGACTLAEPRETFYIELQPDKDGQEAEAMSIHKLDFEALKKDGENPQSAMRKFADWVDNVIPSEGKPVFVGFNAAFDWMFVSDYFWRYLGQNPFGHAPLDIKAFYMGLKKVSWQKTSMRLIRDIPLKHNALQDALDQADLFWDLLQSSES